MMFPSLLSGEVVSALIAGAAGLGTGHFTRRGGRLARLEKEVEACKGRDARFVIIEAGFRMVVGELVRKEPANPVLQMCGDLLNKKLGEPDHDLNSFNELLRQLNDVPGKDDDAEPKPPQ